jgi:hypothetical protein
MGLVQESAVMAGTRRLPATFVHLRQGSHEHGPGGFELLHPAVQHLPDPRGMARHAHESTPGPSGKEFSLPSKTQKTTRATNILDAWPCQTPQQ